MMPTFQEHLFIFGNKSSIQVASSMSNFMPHMLQARGQGLRKRHENTEQKGATLKFRYLPYAQTEFKFMPPIQR